MTVADIYKSRLSLSASDSFSESLVQHLECANDPSVEPRKLTAAENYGRKCFDAVSELKACTDRQQLALASLSGYRAGLKDLNGVPIARPDYISYHVENLLIRIVATNDRALHLTNAVFDLGIPARFRNLNSIMKNDHVSDTGMPTRLKTIDRTVEPYRHGRNIVVHQSTYSDKGMKDWSTFNWLERKGDLPQNLLPFSECAKSRADGYIREMRERFTPVIAELAQQIFSLSEALLPHYEVRFAAYQAST